MTCENCGKTIEDTSGIKVSTGWANEAERLEYEYCGWDCLHEFAGKQA